ncbi:site-specific DNA-methyltransferase [Gemmiger sp.]
MEKLKMETPDIVENNVEKIGALFPAAVTEMRGEDGTLRKGIDFEKLRQLLSRDIVEGGERYEFSWVGKKAAMAEAARPTTETLRPVKADSLDWDTTENLYIEGDNLAALKILQESYLGKVKMIYIDPPYNTGNDFIYADDFMRTQSEENEQMGMFDEEQNRMFRNTDTNGHFHSVWCSMMFSRLLLSRNLLANDGVIFISIDDNECYNLNSICDEVFGAENRIAVFPRLTTKSGKTPSTYMISHDYILCYVKSRKDIFVGMPYSDDSYKFSDEYVSDRGKYNLKQPLDCNSISYSKSLDYPIEHDGITYYPGGSFEKYKERKAGKFLSKDYAWRWSKELYEFGLKNGWIVFQNGRIYTKGYLNATIEKVGTQYAISYREKTRKKSTIDFISNDYSNDIAKKQLAAYDLPVKFDYPKPINLIQELFATYYDKNALIMDFFSGSATTVDSIFNLNAQDQGNRKFILVQYPEKIDDSIYPTICKIGEERIRRAGDKIKAEHPDADLDIGFRVFRIDSSNMRDVFYKPEEFTQTMLGEAVSNIKPDRTDLDLLYACLLDCGVPIHLPHTTTTVDGCTIHNVDNGALMACFDEHIPHSVIRTMAAEAPLQVIFRDSAFAADADKINVTEIFKNLSPDTKVRVI